MCEEEGLYGIEVVFTANQEDGAHLGYDDKYMTMTMTHSEKSHIGQMRAWPYRQECRGHGPTKKNLSYR